MLVEDAQRIPGMTLMGAIDLLRPTEDRPAPEVDVAAQNTASIQQLDALMKGVKKT